MVNNPQELTLSQYVMLSVMAFRGAGVPYPFDDLQQDVGIAIQWLQEAERNERRQGVRQEVLKGNLFIGVTDGKVFFRSNH